MHQAPYELPQSLPDTLIMQPIEYMHGSTSTVPHAWATGVMHGSASTAPYAQATDIVHGSTSTAPLARAIDVVHGSTSTAPLAQSIDVMHGSTSTAPHARATDVTHADGNGIRRRRPVVLDLGGVRHGGGGSALRNAPVDQKVPLMNPNWGVGEFLES